MFKKNTILNNPSEPVEVMALFGFEMTPCQPLTFKRTDGVEVEVDELLRSQVKFEHAEVVHIFDILAAGRRYRLEFNSSSLAWDLQLV